MAKELKKSQHNNYFSLFQFYEPILIIRHEGDRTHCKSLADSSNRKKFSHENCNKMTSLIINLKATSERCFSGQLLSLSIKHRTMSNGLEHFSTNFFSVWKIALQYHRPRLDYIDFLHLCESFLFASQSRDNHQRFERLDKRIPKTCCHQNT